MTKSELDTLVSVEHSFIYGGGFRGVLWSPTVNIIKEWCNEVGINAMFTSSSVKSRSPRVELSYWLIRKEAERSMFILKWSNKND